MTKPISVRLDPETKQKLEQIKNYYKRYYPFVYQKISTGQIIRLAIHCLWVDIKDEI